MHRGVTSVVTNEDKTNLTPKATEILFTFEFETNMLIYQI